MPNRKFNRHFLLTDRKLFKKLLIILFFCILLFCSFTISFGQESIEERESALKSLPQDTHRVDILWRLSYDISASDPKKAELYALEAIELGKKLNYSLGLAKSYTALAISFYVHGDYASHSENLQKALDLYRGMDDQEGEAKILNNLGASFYAQGNFQKSLEFYFNALEISEEKTITSLHARVLNNIGEIYEKLKKPDQALEYYDESYRIFSSMEGVESELQKQTIQTQIFIGILVFVCLGLVVILAIVFFKGKQKQKNIRLLLREKAAYDQLFESVQEAIVVVNKEGRVFRVNEEFTRLFGYPLEEVKGRSVDDLLAPEEYHNEASEVTKKVANGEKVTFETVRQSKNGTKIPVSVLGSRIIVEDKMVAVYGIYRDITDRKKSEEALQYSIKQWQTTFDAMNDPVCILDEDHKISRCNQAMLDYLEKSNDDIIGQTCWKVIHGTEENIKDCPAQKSRQTKTRENLVLKMGKKWFDFTADPILDDSGKVKEVVHTLTDITIRKQAEERLNKHTEELEIFNKAMVDREKRIIEMKEEVNYLCEKLGQKPVYPQIWGSKKHDRKSQQ